MYSVQCIVQCTIVQINRSTKILNNRLELFHYQFHHHEYLNILFVVYAFLLGTAMDISRTIGTTEAAGGGSQAGRPLL